MISLFVVQAAGPLNKANVTSQRKRAVIMKHKHSIAKTKRSALVCSTAKKGKIWLHFFADIIV